jgi:hypothetical protein
MSIGSIAIAEAPIGAQAVANTNNKKGPPPKRIVIALSDLTARPEPR